MNPSPLTERLFNSPLSRALIFSVLLAGCAKEAQDQQDAIMVGIAVGDNLDLPEGLCVKNLDVVDADAEACDFWAVIDGSAYQYIEEFGDFKVSRDLAGYNVYAFPLPFSDFNQSDWIGFDGVPDGWAVYDKSNLVDSVDVVPLVIPAAEECDFNGSRCTFPLDLKNIYILQDHTGAWE